MTIATPETTDSYGNLSLTILIAKPANLDAVDLSTDLTALNSENITCHAVGDWFPTAQTNKVARQRKMCQTKITQALGTTTHETPALQYTYMPQEVDTPGASGNEAYDILPEGVIRYGLLKLGEAGTTPLAVGDRYRLYPMETGPQIPGTSAEDEGGEFVINQEVAFAPGYDGPIEGIIVA